MQLFEYELLKYLYTFSSQSNDINISGNAITIYLKQLQYLLIVLVNYPLIFFCFS